MRHRLSSERVVVECVKGSEIPSALHHDAGRHQLADVVRHAHHHQVTPYIDRAMRAAGHSVGETRAMAAGLAGAATSNAMRQLTALADLRWVADRLVASSTPWCLVKGPVLAERVYPDPALRTSRDLDVVVPAERYGAVVEALEMGGGLLLDSNWEVAISQRRGQLHVRLPHGTTMDLHWHLVNAGPIRDTFSISMPSVWNERRTVSIHDMPVDTLSVTDTVVHLGLHAALGGAWCLRWLNDLNLVVAHEHVDWDAVIVRARQWGASRLLGIALLRSWRLLGADVPDDVLVSLLGSRSHRAILQRLDRMWSPTAATHPLAPGRLWPQLVRDTRADTVRAAAWRLRRRAGNGLRGFWYRRERPEMMTPSGGHEGRARYLRLVELGQLDAPVRASAGV